MSRKPFDDVDREERRPERRRAPEKKGMNALLIILLVAGIGLFACVTASGLAALLFWAGPPSRPVVDGDLASIRAEWKKNPVAVIERYQGKAVRLRGYVRKIDQNPAHQTYVVLTSSEADNTYGETATYVFLLSDDLVRQMKNHPIGSQITVEVAFLEPKEAMRTTAIRIAP